LIHSKGTGGKDHLLNWKVIYQSSQDNEVMAALANPMLVSGHAASASLDLAQESDL
jgi:hypothetical protein